MSRRFEHYKILAEIGRGGMGIVYKAHDERTNTDVAIKQLILENIDSTKHKEFRDRFRREAQTALRLVHKNIVSVLEISQDPDSYYYVMEFLEGHNLRREIANRGGICEPRAFLNILEQVAAGLSYAHSMNVIHRDVKPDNIFIMEDGTVKVTDFGIARVADLEETKLTKTGVMLGTLAYVSPEQLQNAKTVDHRADIFSLGVVSYEALCGYLPFTGDGIAATIVRIMSQEELPLMNMNTAISAEISGTVSRALRKKPRDRYRSVNEFIRDFKHAVDITCGDIRYDTMNIDAFTSAPEGGAPVRFSHAITPTDFEAQIDDFNTDPELMQGSNISQQAEMRDSSSHEIGSNKNKADGTANSPGAGHALFSATSDSNADATTNPNEHATNLDIGAVAKENSVDRISFARDEHATNLDFVRPGSNVRPVENTRGGVLDDHPTNLDIDTGDLTPKTAAQANLPDTTFASANMSDFGLEVTLDKDGILKEKQRSKFSASGKYKPISPGDKNSAAKEEHVSDDMRPEEFRRTPPPTPPSARPARADTPFIQPTYNPMKLVMTIKSHGAKEKPFVELSATSYRSGKLLVADAAMRKVHTFSRDGRWLCDLVQRPEISSKTGGGMFTKPSGIAIDERGRAYICDSSDHYIRIFDGQGLFIKEFKNIQGTEGGLAGITIDSTGLLYLSDSTNGCLQVFQSDVGVWVRKIGTKGTEPGQLQLPSGLAADRLNRIYVVDYGVCRVSVFNKSGALVRTFGQKGTQRGMFNVPRAIAIDKQDRIFVLDSLNHRVQVFGQGGDWLYTFGSLGSGPEQFVGPSGLSIDNENSLLFVADKGNKRIQVLELGFK
ncbi:MAG: protein kinase [Candidatus Melainabacteria bacterium]|nr:protein kinase [Candidatus Melainabacteria bacterium]